MNRFIYVNSNIIVWVLVLIFLGIMFSTFLVQSIYQASDFISSDIKEYKDYALMENAVTYYLGVSSADYKMLYEFMHISDDEKQKEYSSMLDDTLKSINIIKVKKGLNNIYIVYFYLNETAENESRIVLQINEKKNTYRVLYDSIYESLG